MTDRLKVTCEKCNAELTHICKPELKETFIRLYGFVPESFPTDSEGERIPFLNSERLYDLLGKEDYRTLNSLINCLAREAGLDPEALAGIAYKKLEDEKKEREAREVLKAQRRAQRKAKETDGS